MVLIDKGSVCSIIRNGGYPEATSLNDTLAATVKFHTTIRSCQCREPVVFISEGRASAVRVRNGLQHSMIIWRVWLTGISGWHGLQLYLIIRRQVGWLVLNKLCKIPT